MVINPNQNSKLAPQKTATNDMKATLLVKSCDDEPVILNAREVLADCDLLNPLVNINNFSVCDKKVKSASQRKGMMSRNSLLVSSLLILRWSSLGSKGETTVRERGSDNT